MMLVSNVYTLEYYTMQRNHYNIIDHQRLKATVLTEYKPNEDTIVYELKLDRLINNCLDLINRKYVYGEYIETNLNISKARMHSNLKETFEFFYLLGTDHIDIYAVCRYLGKQLEITVDSFKSLTLETNNKKVIYAKEQTNKN